MLHRQEVTFLLMTQYLTAAEMISLHRLVGSLLTDDCGAFSDLVLCHSKDFAVICLFGLMLVLKLDVYV